MRGGSCLDLCPTFTTFGKVIANNKVQFLILSFLNLAFLAFFYGDVLLQPNQHLYSADGDGIKNYYTYAYHINNNTSTTNFEGFNYPYGENFLYTDSQPLFSILLQKLNRLFPFIGNYSIGFINLLMLLSFYIGSVFLFLLFKQLKIPPLLSVLSAVGVMVLSPQIFRMNGHLALSYSCFIPLTIYLLYQFFNSRRTKFWTSVLIVNNIFWLLIHAYLGIIAISLLLTFELSMLVSLIIAQRSYNWKKGIALLSTALIPICLFLILKTTTDQHLNRDTNPYGFFEYYADFDTILLPHHGFFSDFIFSLLPSFTQTWEGWAYIGIGSIITLFIFIALSFKKSVFSRQIKLLYFENQFLRFLLSGSIIVLIFSFGVPFRWGLENWLEYIPIVKQFRAIGRFAWVFYFAISISAVYLIHQFSTAVKQKHLSKLILLSLPLFMVIEGTPYHQEVSNKSLKNSNHFNKKHLSIEIAEGINSIETTNYQALIPLPYYSIGTENYEREGGDQVYNLSMIFSYHLKMPILGSYLTRPSLEEGRNSLQTLSPCSYSKVIQKDIPCKKPFLIIKSQEGLEKDEKILLSRSKLVFSTKQYELYHLEYDSLFRNTLDHELKTFHEKKQSLIKEGQYWTNDSSEFFHINSKLKLIKNDCNQLFTLKNNVLDLGVEYEASAWFFSGGENFGQDKLNFLEFKLIETIDNKVVQEKTIEVMSASTIHDRWTRAEITFVPTDSRGQIEFICIGNDPINRSLEIEDFFLSKISQNTYWFNRDSTILFNNNHRLKY